MRGQVSVEFIIIALLLTSVLLFSVFVFSEKNSGVILAKENKEAKYLADKVARTINNVFLAGNGAQGNVLLEKNFDYTITISNNAVQVNYRTNFVDSALLTDFITVNSIDPGNWVNVRNSEGEIIIENT